VIPGPAALHAAPLELLLTYPWGLLRQLERPYGRGGEVLVFGASRETESFIGHPLVVVELGRFQLGFGLQQGRKAGRV